MRRCRRLRLAGDQPPRRRDDVDYFRTRQLSSSCRDDREPRVQRCRDAAATGACRAVRTRIDGGGRSEEHTSELQSLMRISYAVFCLKKKKKKKEENI